MVITETVEKYASQIEAERAKTPYALAVTDAMSRFHPTVVNQIKAAFDGNIIGMTNGTHGNGMPKTHAYRYAEKSVSIGFIDGMNHEKALYEIAAVHSALRTRYRGVDPLVESARILIPFVDARGHSLSEDHLDPNDPRNPTVIIPGEAIFMQQVERALEGYDFSVFVDIHNPWESTEWLQREKTLTLTTNRLLLEDLASIGLTEDSRPVSFLSTDDGSMNDAFDMTQRAIAMGIDADIGLMEKMRVHGRVEGKFLYGKVQQRTVIRDDMFSSGKTMLETVSVVDELGAEEISIVTPHVTATPETLENIIKLLKNPKVRTMIWTDSMPVAQELYTAIQGLESVLSEDERAKLRIVHIGEWLGETAVQIAKAKDIEEAKRLLRQDRIHIRRPENLFYEITGKPYPVAEFIGSKHPATGIIFPLSEVDFTHL